MVGHCVTKASSGGKQPQTPELQPLPGVVATGVPVAPERGSQRCCAAGQPESERDQPRSLLGVQDFGRSAGCWDNESVGRQLLQH